MSRPTRTHASRATVMSVDMSTSFFWTSWLAASGAPNCVRSKV
jgi:hypothetical protein